MMLDVLCTSLARLGPWLVVINDGRLGSGCAELAVYDGETVELIDYEHAQMLLDIAAGHLPLLEA